MSRCVRLFVLVASIDFTKGSRAGTTDEYSVRLQMQGQVVQIVCVCLDEILQVDCVVVTPASD